MAISGVGDWDGPNLRVMEIRIFLREGLESYSRTVDNFKEFQSGIYMEEAKIIRLIARMGWFRSNASVAFHHTIVLGIAFLPKCIVVLCLSTLALNVMPYVGLGISVWRLVRRDYGDAGGDAANRAKLAAALDIFYALVLLQTLVVIYWANLRVMLKYSVLHVLRVTKQQCPQVVVMYCSETTRKFKKDRELPDNWNLMTYAIGLLQSASGDDDHLWGARILDKLFDTKDIISVRQEILSSRSSIQNLIGMIGRSGTAGNIENRECAARILAHLAGDLHVAHFPGTLQCICSLLESCNQFCEACPLLEKNPDEQSRSLETFQRQDVAHMAVPIQDQTDHEQEQVVSPSSDGLAQLAQRIQPTELPKRKDAFLIVTQQIRKAIKESRFTYTFRGPKELVSQGLLILEGLTRDKVNCTEISKQQVLISKITSPLSSPDFLIIVREDTMVVPMLSKSLTALSRILACPGDGATRLRQELASTTEAVSNLMAILETDSGAAQELHGQALEILTELAFDDSFKKLEFNKLLKALLCIFLEEAPSNNTVVQVEQADRENATRLMRGKAGEALARLIPVSTARERDVYVADIISKQEAINLLTKVIDQILSSKMGADAAENFVENQPPEDRKFMAAMLSLAVVICKENVISREDFARSTPEDAALAKKLKDILKVNKQCMAESECLRVVKLTCQMVIAMTQAKPSCIRYFKEHNFKEALTETLGTMSEVDNCMLFAGNDREVIKPARSLASLVKEAQELLKTAQEQGN
ncbi:uncharacterized protein LOC101756682 isoform X2 [Setaria italica]|uniref:uncharacterized protein LOC101756682 isoform X2 n=1 Tax=Setaria italica TaxID=4555 RepID=UPI0003509D90|nr:uncharacterized protein LOC101756682 isoform X2 [Setaria italica]